MSRVNTKKDASGRTLVIEEGTFKDKFVFRSVQYDFKFHGLLVGIDDDGALMTEMLEDWLSENFDKETGADALEKFWPGMSLDDPTQTPVYENHTSGAQRIWKALPHRSIQDARTVEQEHGRQQYIEIGMSDSFSYLYWGNTFDQRQLVVVERERGHLLVQHFQDSVNQM